MALPIPNNQSSQKCLIIFFQFKAKKMHFDGFIFQV
jgi:hypothetical protein